MRQGRDAAEAGDKATLGTALHTLTERADRGELLRRLPAAQAADLAAYLSATAPLTQVRIETHLVLDALEVAGTTDRIVEVGGRRYIADLKTGSIDYGIVKIAAQLAAYLRSDTYDVTTGDRGPLEVDQGRGLVIHLPAGQARCRLLWVDLETGWRAVQVAGDVRRLRRLRLHDLAAPCDLGTTDPARREIEAEVAAATTPDQVRVVWAAHQDAWTDDLTDLAAARVAHLEQHQRAEVYRTSR